MFVNYSVLISINEIFFSADILKMDFSDSEFSEEEENLSFVPVKKSPQKPVITGKKHLNDLKNLLELDTYQAKLEKKRRKRKAAKARKLGLSVNSNGEKLIQTLASKSLGLTEAPEVVTFVDHKKRNKSKTNQSEDSQLDNEIKKTIKEITLKDARFEVFKFGVSGMDKKSKEEANTALALRLGAKPEKNKCIDYQQLKEERILEREEKAMLEEERKQSLQGVRKSSKNSTASSKKSNSKVKKKKGSKNDFRVGSFDGRMLKLSQKDLNALKKK